MEEIIKNASDCGELSTSNRPGNKVAGALLLGLTGVALAGVYAVTFPFVSPAFRRICLPYVPATSRQVQNVIEALKGRRGNVLDLGSGDGRLVIEAGKRGFTAAGVELNYWLVWYSRYSAYRHGLHRKVKFFRQDLWKINLESYNNVIIFGVQEMMDDLETKIRREMPTAGYVVVCRFPFKSWHPNKTIGYGIDTVWVYEKQSS